VTGDLTSAFNFSNPNNAVVSLPSTVAYEPPDNERHPDYIPTVPADQALPQQEHGVRPARALPYELHVDGKASAEGTLELKFRNTGKAAAVFHVRSVDARKGPWTYTVGVRDEVSDSFGSSGDSSYDLSVYGPNGFLRTFVGTYGKDSANLSVKAIYETELEGIILEVRNHGKNTEQVHLVEAYSGDSTKVWLDPHQSFETFWQLKKSFGWYDLTLTASSDKNFLRHLAGHLETGKDSLTDPAIAATKTLSAVVS
jgi:phospholipase C